MSTTTNTLQRSIKAWIYEAIGKGQSVINGLTKGDAQEVLEVSRKNWIINGDHQVDQRGLLPVTGCTSGVYESTDRWETYLSGITSNSSLTNGFLKLTATATDGALGMSQLIEDYTSLQGQAVTVSATIKTNNIDGRLMLADGVGSSSVAVTADGNAHEISLTHTVDGSATKAQLFIIVSTSTGASTTIASGDYIEFTNVKLEIGDTHTPFETRSYAEELRDCRGYWWQPDASGNAESKYGTGIATSTTNAHIIIDSASFNSIPDEIDFGTIGNLALYDGTTFRTLTGLSVSGACTSDTVTLYATVASGLTAGNVYHLVNNNTTSGYLGVGNEI
jgi:hypothetical protein